MYPACAMELYASMRFKLVCTMADKFPKNMLSAAATHSAQNHRGGAASTLARMRSASANAAALGPVDSRAVTGAGAPSYTSGVQSWNGAAATLKAKPIKMNPRPIFKSECAESLANGVMRSRCVEPVAPNDNAIPYRKNAVAKEPR